MPHYKKFSLVAIPLALGLGLTAVAAYADEDDLAVVHAKVSLVQAIGIAEQHANGKASNAEYDHSMRGWRYEVDVVSGAKVFEVKVDADTGAVISSVEERHR